MASGKAENKAPQGKKKAGVEAPDREQYDKAQEQIRVEIDGLQAELQAVNKQIEEKSHGKEEFLKRKNDMKKKLDEYQRIIGDHEKEKGELRSSIKKKNDEARQERSKLNDTKSKLKYNSIEAIDGKIAEIENKMHHTSLSLKEEKDFMKQLSELRASKPQIAKYTRMEAQASTGGDNMAPTRERMDVLNEHIAEARSAKKAQTMQYTKLIEQRQGAMKDVPALFEKKEGIQASIAAKIKQRRLLQDHFNLENKQFNEAKAEERAIKYEKNKAESLARQAAKEKERAEQMTEREEEQPHIVETTDIEQILTYCRSLLPKEEEAKEDTTDVKHNNPEGSMVLSSKKDRGAEMWIAPKKGKKQQKKKAEKKDTPVKHTAGSIRMFAQYDIVAPSTTAEVPAIIEKLQARLDTLNVEVKDWESLKEQRRVERKKQQDEALAKAQAKAEEAEAAKKAALERASAVVAEETA